MSDKTEELKTLKQIVIKKHIKLTFTPHNVLIMS